MKWSAPVFGNVPRKAGLVRVAFDALQTKVDVAISPNGEVERQEQLALDAEQLETCLPHPRLARQLRSVAVVKQKIKRRAPTPVDGHPYRVPTRDTETAAPDPRFTFVRIAPSMTS